MPNQKIFSELALPPQFIALINEVGPKLSLSPAVLNMIAGGTPPPPPAQLPWPTGPMAQPGTWIANLSPQYPAFPAIMQRLAALNATQKTAATNALMRWKDAAANTIQTILQIEVNKLAGMADNATLTTMLTQQGSAAMQAWKDAGLDGISGTPSPLPKSQRK